jgi:hypothetical protein
VLRCDTLPCVQLPVLPSVRVATINEQGSFDARTWVAQAAVVFPHLEHLHVGPELHKGGMGHWMPLFTKLPTLTQITWCLPRYGVRYPYRLKNIADLMAAPRKAPEIVPAPQVRRMAPDADIDGTYAERFPNIEELYLWRRDWLACAFMPTIRSLTHLRVLAVNSVTVGAGTVRRRAARRVDTIFTDAETAQLLVALPLLEVLDLSVYNGRNPHLTFATADYDGVVASRLRTLKAAGAAQLRGAGLRALARICPNLRHLDVRAAFAMSRQEFIDGLVELSAASVAAATTTETQPQKPVQRLRLQKLRRLYSSFRRRLPKVLNFNTYCSGWSAVQHEEFDRPMDVRDAELEPPLEPEHVFMYFSPRRNKRRLPQLPNDGIDVHVQVLVHLNDPAPHEIASQPERGVVFV